MTGEEKTPRRLAAGFAEATEADWRALVSRSNAGSVEALQARSDDGLPVGPIYRPGHEAPIATRPPGKRWTAFQRLDRGDIPALAGTIEAAVRGGATGIELVFAASPAARDCGLAPDVEMGILAERLPADVAVRIDAGEDTPSLTANLGRALGRGVDAVFDPFATLAARGGLAASLDAVCGSIAALIEDRRGAGRLFAADGRPWHDAGASEAQELSAMLASLASLLRRLAEIGIAPPAFLPRLGVTVSADADQFLTIAKLRAARLIFARLAEAMGIEVVPPLHAETAWRMLSRREPVMNMVRATTAAFAAAAGGADSITVLPFSRDDARFADRMARNTQTILTEESAVFRVADPAAGSGAIERLTAELAAAAWSSFTDIERQGGLIEALRAGSVQRDIAAMQERRHRDVSTRRIELVGVNVHVDHDSMPVRRGSAPPATQVTAMVEKLRPRRLSEAFEALAERAARLAAEGRDVSVFLAHLAGAESDAAPADAFAAGGFRVRVSGPFATAGEATAAYAASGAPVGCIMAGPNQRELAGEVAAGFRSAGARFVVATADIPHADARLAADSDLIALLSAALDRIGAAEEKGGARQPDKRGVGS
jgi:methylmalonyl-CoA mutase